MADDAAITPFYPIGTYVTGIEPGTSASTVASGIGTQNCTVKKILNADGSENTQTVGTGNKLAVYVGDTLVQQYEIVVYGDINGDGKVSNLDLVLMQIQILELKVSPAVVWKRQTSARTAVFPIRIWLFYKNTYWESHRLISERKNWESRNEEKKKIAMMMMALSLTFGVVGVPQTVFAASGSTSVSVSSGSVNIGDTVTVTVKSERSIRRKGECDHDAVL